ncbi:MAG: metal ABC transporter permease [Anaerolineae bacterium]
MSDWLLVPLQFSFISRALVAAVIVGIVCSVLGTYIVLQGMAFLGDALAHTILPGVVIAFQLGLQLAMGALVFGVLTALGFGALTESEVL